MTAMTNILRRDNREADHAPRRHSESQSRKKQAADPLCYKKWALLKRDPFFILKLLLSAHAHVHLHGRDRFRFRDLFHGCYIHPAFRFHGNFHDRG